MKWTIMLILAVVLVAVWLLMRSSKIPAIDAREHLKQGALVIDVRSSGEYNSDHLPSAVNIPLDVIETALPVRVPDKNKVLLLHCQSGMRSAVAMKKLKSIGYTHVYNLGSLPQAKAVVDDVDDE